MLRISQLKLPVTHTEAELKKKIAHTLMCRNEAVQSYEIVKQSLDARKKPELFYVYTVDVKADNEKHLSGKNVQGMCRFMRQHLMFFRKAAV